MVKMNKLMTPKEVAEVLSVSEKAVKDWLRAGKLQGVKVGSLWRVEQSVVEQYIERKGTLQQMVKDESQRLSDTGERGPVLGVLCIKCGHTYLTDMMKMLEAAARGKMPKCPQCGARVLDDAITKKSAQGYFS